MTATDLPQLQAHDVVTLLDNAAFATPWRMTRLPGGGNNRVYRIESGGRALVLKQYFHSTDDPRDRLGAEFALSSFAWRNGVLSLPKPIAADFQRRLGLYAFVDGAQLGTRRGRRRRCRPGAGLCAGARRTARRRGRPDLARRLRGVLPLRRPSGAGRASRPQSRPHRCRRRAAGGCGAVRLADTDPRLGQACGTGAGRCGARQDRDRRRARRARSAPSRRRISASTMRCADRTARSASSISNMPAGTTPPSWSAISSASPRCRCRASSTRASPTASLRRGRARACTASASTCCCRSTGLKWVCIMLNEFLPAGGQRRRFAAGADAEARRAAQLAKARTALQALEV